MRYASGESFFASSATFAREYGVTSYQAREYFVDDEELEAASEGMSCSSGVPTVLLAAEVGGATARESPSAAAGTTKSRLTRIARAMRIGRPFREVAVAVRVFVIADATSERVNQ